MNDSKLFPITADTIDFIISGENVVSSVLFFKPYGDDNIKICYGRSKNNEINSLITVGEIPILKWKTLKNFSSYCAGYGMQYAGEKILKTINDLNIYSELDIKEAFIAAAPLLNHLAGGFYMLSFIEHYPVDISGDFFWSISNREKKYRFNYVQTSGKAFPAYLVPSVPAFNYELKTNEQKKHAVDVSSVPVVYYFDDFMSVIIKGHEQAAAAYFNNEKIRCLTIIPCSGYAHDSKNVTSLFFASNQIDASIADNELLSEMIKHKNDKIINFDTLELHINKRCEKWNKRCPILDDAALSRNSYPSLKTIEGIAILKDISDLRIESLLNMASPDYKLLEILFGTLIGLNDKRSYNLAMKLAASDLYIGLWPQAYSHLANFKNKEVEDLFINYLINDTAGFSDIKTIVDNYFEAQ